MTSANANGVAALQSEESKSIALYSFGHSDQTIHGCRDQTASQFP